MMKKKRKRLIVCVAIALIAASSAEPAEENVDKPKVLKTAFAEQPAEKPQPAGVDIWTAAANGNLEAIRQ